MRLACSADIHVKEGDEERVREMFSRVKDEADALVVAGDLTDRGTYGQVEALIRGLRHVDVPVVTVLGNHDHEGGYEKDVLRMLGSAGIHCLDRRRSTLVLGDVGFAGVKGFGGGFGPRMVRGFGEDSVKAFVSASVVEAEALRGGLGSLDTPRKVVVTHYAPVLATLQGEPAEIQPFLGTTRLEQAIDDDGSVVLALHGHAHHGATHGKTEGGVPVHNVALPVLRAQGHERAYVVLDV